MPELPELEIIAHRLAEKLAGEVITQVTVHDHLVIHGLPVSEFCESIVGESFLEFRADGKFMILTLEQHDLVINPMLTGRFRLTTRFKKPTKVDMLSIKTENTTLWYSDRKRMGRVYVVAKGNYESVADFVGRGPSPLDPEFTLEKFKDRLRHYRGQIKNVLRNQKFVKGIGNAYADEILLYAGILPFRRKSSLTESEIERLYSSMTQLLRKYVEILSERRLNELASEKRDFLMVHNKGGGICPLCGGRISEVAANRFKTNYCQTCQK